MPTRPREHQVETRGMRAFEHALPDAWTFDVPAQGNDYGIDATIELFEDDGAAMALGLYAQVRGTDIEGDRALSLSIDVDDWEHYLRLDRPVLLVRHLRATDDLYVRWAHLAVRQHPPPGQQTVTARWRPEDRWVNETARRVIDDVRRFREARSAAITRPIIIHANVSCDASSGARFVRQVRSALRRFITNLGHLASLAPEASDAGAALVRILIHDVDCTVDFGGIAFADASFPEDINNPSAPLRLAANVLTFAGLTASWAGHDLVAGEFLKTVLHEAPIRFSALASKHITTALVRARLLDEAVRYTEHLLDSTAGLGDASAVDLATTALYVEGVDRSLLDPLMGRYADVVGEVCNAASYAAALNKLANYLRHGPQDPDRNRRALSLYNRVRTLEPAYLERSDYVAAVAATLFDLHRPLRATMWYEKAAALGLDSPFSQACWGDALLNAGRFAEAVEKIAPFISEPDTLRSKPYWWVRHQLAQRLRGRFGDLVHRDPTAAVSIEYPAEHQSAQEHFDAAEAQLSLDPLLASAWFNSALALHQLGDAVEAGIRFAFAASIQYGGAESWANAFIALALSAEDEAARTWSTAIGYAGFDSIGESFADAVEAAVATQDDPDRLEPLLAWLDVVRESQIGTGLGHITPLILRLD